ncbi:putative porin [Colwellia sp. TT2012]|uniref:putative porin n=1 Tax=Colwellia sp. TT2012 TaxID=1720342 RepID=UPI00070D1678|nr:putative porin [Colwellia sp. TT2012]
MKVSKLSALAAFLLSNAVLAESYQSFSTLNYSQKNQTVNEPVFDYYSKWDSASIVLSSQYYFEEQQTLGPLNEFDYINTSSNIYASLSNSNIETFTSRIDGVNWKNSNNTVDIGGQWITNNFIIGAGYTYIKSENTVGSHTYDNSLSYYSTELGYLISDDLVISAHYNDGGDGDDFFNYSASYNWQLAGSDYIGFSYNVDENFDIHQLSSRYFFGVGEESYLVLGGAYTLDNRDVVFVDDYWSVNASYYYDAKTSISVVYSDEYSFGEGDYYGVSASYFINSNYSVQAGYNSVVDSKDDFKLDGYYLSFGAQF